MYYLILEVLLDVLYVLRGTLRGAISHPPPLAQKLYRGGLWGAGGGQCSHTEFFYNFFYPTRNFSYTSIRSTILPHQGVEQIAISPQLVQLSLAYFCKYTPSLGNS